MLLKQKRAHIAGSGANGFHLIDALQLIRGSWQSLKLTDSYKGHDFLNCSSMAAIERAVAGNAAVVFSRTAALHRTPAIAAEPKESAQKLWLRNVLRYFTVPLGMLLVAHHVIVNAFDLNIEYLWVASTMVPFVFGFIFFLASGRGAGSAVSLAIALGVIAVIGMTVSQSLNSGDPILPQTRFEWRDNVQFMAGIALSFLVGHALAHVPAVRSKFGKR